MATLQQVRTLADSKLTTFWTWLTTKQDAYFVKHGKYFQLIAGSALTVDGASTTFTVRSPSDEAYAIDIDYSYIDSIPFELSVTEWAGGYSTPGYEAIATILYNNTIYRRRRTNGAIDTGWAVIDPPNVPSTQ